MCHLLSFIHSKNIACRACTQCHACTLHAITLPVSLQTHTPILLCTGYLLQICAVVVVGALRHRIYLMDLGEETQAELPITEVLAGERKEQRRDDVS